MGNSRKPIFDEKILDQIIFNQLLIEIKDGIIVSACIDIKLECEWEVGNLKIQNPNIRIFYID